MVQAVGVQCVVFPVEPDETASGISHLCGMNQSAAHSGWLPELGAITPERTPPASFPGTCTSDDSHSQEGPVELPSAFDVYLVRLQPTGASALGGNSSSSLHKLLSRMLLPPTT